MSAQVSQEKFPFANGDLITSVKSSSREYEVRLTHDDSGAVKKCEIRATSGPLQAKWIPMNLETAGDYRLAPVPAPVVLKAAPALPEETETIPAPPKTVKPRRSLIPLGDLCKQEGVNIRSAKAAAKAGKLPAELVEGVWHAKEKDFKAWNETVSHWQRPSHPDMLSVADVAAMVGRKEDVIRKDIKAGLLEGVSIGGTRDNYRFTRAQVEAYQEKTAAIPQRKSRKERVEVTNAKSRGTRLVGKPHTHGVKDNPKNPKEIGSRSWCCWEILEKHEMKATKQQLNEGVLKMRVEIFRCENETEETVKRDVANLWSNWLRGRWGLIAHLEKSAKPGQPAKIVIDGVTKEKAA